jgi:polyisoprenoid-binding protein YceI
MSTVETMTAAPVGTWEIDPVHSTVAFEVEYLTGTFRGQFRDIDGALAVGEDGTATLEGRARVASVDVKDEMLAGHLQSPDFFDAERFPEIAVRVDGVDLSGGELRAQGEITIRGVTKPVEIAGSITAPAPDPYGVERIGAVLSAAVDRTDFGVSWNAPLPSGEQALAEEVRINAELFFKKAD